MAPDGGLSGTQGTFGVVLAQGDVELREAAGPVDCNMETGNSKRSELAGYAASLELLCMFVHFLDCRPNLIMHTKTWIDSSSAGRHLESLLKKTNTTSKYPHDPDLLSHICWMWEQLPTVTHTIGWVKSHQDSETPYINLPRNAQLNVLADRLATAYLEKTIPANLRPQKKSAIF